MSSDVEQRLRKGLHEDASRARLANPDRPADPEVRSLQYAENASRPPRRLVAAAVAVALIVTAGAVFVDNARDTEVTASPDPADTVTATTEPTTTTSEPIETAFEAIDGTTLARAENVKVVRMAGTDGVVTCPGCAPGIGGRMLNVDAAEEHGKVTGEFRIDNVVVSVQCARTNRSVPYWSDLVLGGVVIANPDGHATLDGVGVVLGDLVALAIRIPAAPQPRLRGRDDQVQRVTLYEKSSWHGEQATSASCHELIESFPPNLDGGFFEDVRAVDEAR